jgi:hypothetical protein
MRFAAKYGRFMVQIRPLVQEIYATGGVHVIQEGVFAEFRPEGLKPFERELVLQHWVFNGAYQELDEATHIQPDYRIGVLDTLVEQQQRMWSDETRELVEKTLIELQYFDNVLLLPSTHIPPPWPTYDDWAGTPEELVVRLGEQGFDLETTLEYELASKNRPEVVKELETALDAAPKDEEILA